MRKYTFLLACTMFAFISCKSTQDVADEETQKPYIVVNGDTLDLYMDEITVDTSATGQLGEEQEVYRTSRTRHFDLLHTDLEISFNWQNQTAEGKALLTLKPYFYPSRQVEIDAQAMDIFKVALVQAKDTQELIYDYDKRIINISLNKEYSRNETLKLFIHYRANPNEVGNEGSEAITGAKGLYFINPLGTEKKPRQLWTQGETQSTSCWMPTIDAPNERMTQDIFITVNDSLQTFSNGVLVKSTKKENLRTDHWSMKKPHAPYLAAMVVGEFAVFNDKWKNIPLKYIVEKEFASSAMAIFKNTPEMLSFYSSILNYPYPWPKYDQAVVSDFVSGAMENTTMTIHGDMLKLDRRELFDRNYEDVIAHELFHQWFGNVVTCESWANLPLNESFATYGEYLWKEYKYGRNEADNHLQNDLISYLNESSHKQEKLIRFNYENQEDMFDAHSYQKGGCILHMLRKQVGDSAFFQALNLYLEKNEFQSVEIHNLRMAFEEVTGRDMNLFFNQWFLSSGHPYLEVVHYYNEESQLFTFEVSQQQDLSNTPLYQIPIEVAFHYKNRTVLDTVHISKSFEIFSFELFEKPEWVSFDTEKSLVGYIKEVKHPEIWLTQFVDGKVFKDKYNAIKAIEEIGDLDFQKQLVQIGLNDSFWKIRELSVAMLNNLPIEERDSFVKKIQKMSLQDKNSTVRTGAVSMLAYTPHEENAETALKALSDSSYEVNAAALNALLAADTALARKKAEEFLSSYSDIVRITALSIATGNSDKDFTEVFRKEIFEGKDYLQYYTIPMFARYLIKAEDPITVKNGLEMINKFEPKSDNETLTAMFISQLNRQVKATYQDRKKILKAKIAATEDPARKAELEDRLRQVEGVLQAALDF